MRMTLRHYVCSTRRKSRRCPGKSFLVRSLLARRMTELIPTVGMESQHSIGAPTCHDFPRFVIISEKSRPEVWNRWRWSRFFGKDLLRANFQKKCFRKDSPRHRTMFCVQISWKLGDRKLAKSCVVYLAKKQNFRKVSRSRFCADRAQNLSGPAPNSILGVPQISSKSVHFRRSYSRMREHHWNMPQSISNTWQSFFAE